MTTTLTDRYVYAATRWLPGKTRSEVADELRERIGDTVAARGGSPAAERETLEELGDPLRVAVDYTGREPALIGPRYFFIWLRLTLVLLAIIPPLVAAVEIVTGVVDEDSIGSVIGSAVGTAIEVAVHVAFWTTVVFAVLDWTGTPATDKGGWSLDQLPEPDSAGTVPELIAGLLVTAAMAGAVLWQHFRSPLVEDGERIPLADPDLWSWYLPLVLLVIALEAAHCLWIHRTGWTWAAAHANAVIGLMFTIPTVVLLANDALVNPDVVTQQGWDPALTSDIMGWIALGLAVIGVWEIADGYRKAYVRSRVGVKAQ